MHNNITTTYTSTIDKEKLTREEYLRDNYGNLVKHIEVIMTKKEFLMCYDAWIKNREDSNE